MDTKTPANVVTKFVHIASGTKRFLLLTDVSLDVSTYRLDGVGDFAIEGEPPFELKAKVGQRVRTMAITMVKPQDVEYRYSEIPAWVTRDVTAGLKDSSLIVEYLDQSATAAEKLQAKRAALSRYGTDSCRLLWRALDTAFVSQGRVIDYIEYEALVKAKSVISAAHRDELKAYVQSRVSSIKPMTYTADELRSLVSSMQSKPPAKQWTSGSDSISEAIESVAAGQDEERI